MSDLSIKDAAPIAPLPEKLQDVSSTEAGKSPAKTSTQDGALASQVSPAVPLSLNDESTMSLPTDTVTQMVGEIKEILSSSPSKIPIRKILASTNDLALDTSSSPASPEESPATKRKSMSPSQKEEMANRLYSRAMELKEKRDKLYSQPKEECTFKPTINRTPSKREELDKDRFLVLHEQAEEMARRKEELKQSLESQFTYKPEISSLARRLSARHEAEEKPPSSRAEELYKMAHELEAKREEKKKELEKKEAEECTFQPKIKKTKGKSPPKQPLYDAELMKQKRLEKERKKAELELAECSFKPQISKKTHDVPKTFFERLQEADKKKKERLEALRKEKEHQIEQEITFRPAINDSKAPKVQEKVPFHERLFNKEQLQAQALEREQKKIEIEAQTCTFKPDIIPAPVTLERRGSVFDRLFEEQKKKQEMLDLAEQEKIKKELEECTFKPTVLVDPAEILKEVPQEPVWERLSNDKKQIIEQRDKMKEELEQKECTFKPNIQASLAETSRRMSLRRPSSPQLQRSPSKVEDKPEDAVTPVPAVVEPSTDATDVTESKAVLADYDNWAASLEEKMRELK
ncbi:hypothetical protein AeMF1_001753 [Aphanomyces euteiches]|nr:hypothetical protein AeMF1_001753 [Aphanomyces euteiches]